MRKWETPLLSGSPSTGFLPLVELVDALWVHACVPLLGALFYGRRPGQPSSSFLARGPASKVLLLLLLLPQVRLHGHLELRKVLLWSRGELDGSSAAEAQLLP